MLTETIDLFLIMIASPGTQQCPKNVHGIKKKTRDGFLLSIGILNAPSDAQNHKSLLGYRYISTQPQATTEA